MSPRAQTETIRFDYHRTIIGFHGTRRDTARRLVAGDPFDSSTNDDDWLGHGIYFWEYAPQQAWWWAQRRYKRDAAVVGAMIRLGYCLDLFDPGNIRQVEGAYKGLRRTFRDAGRRVPANANNHKYLDCAVFNFLYTQLAKRNYNIDSTRAVFVPFVGGKVPRLWNRSAIFHGGHVQICVRNTDNILAVWSVRKDGRYGDNDNG